MLHEKLLAEIESKVSDTSVTEPDVKIFIDESSAFWITDEGKYVWLQHHDGLAGYIDEHHVEVERNTPEGVGNHGVIWNNLDFMSPFHISDFTEKIKTINSL